jgi:hypothetical protein
LTICSGRETKFDGRDYPVGKDLHSTVALTLNDDNSFEETDKHDGKVRLPRMSVSKDGAKMKG